MRVQDRENEGQKKEESREPARDFREHICRLCAKNVFRHAAAKGCAQALTFWPLHQDHEDHEERDKNVEPEKDIDQKGHRDGQYRQPAQFVNEGLGGAVWMAVQRQALTRHPLSCFDFESVPNLVELPKSHFA